MPCDDGRMTSETEGRRFVPTGSISIGMTDTDELVGWLRAQLDEDERVAREAGYRASAWPLGDTWWLEGVEHNVVGAEEAYCYPHNAAHIARWDPARVLAEVDAKRRIIEDAEFWMWNDDRGGPDPMSASALRLLALPYADRPGYREQWRP